MGLGFGLCLGKQVVCLFLCGLKLFACLLLRGFQLLLCLCLGFGKLFACLLLQGLKLLLRLCLGGVKAFVCFSLCDVELLLSFGFGVVHVLLSLGLGAFHSAFCLFLDSSQLSLRLVFNLVGLFCEHLVFGDESLLTAFLCKPTNDAAHDEGRDAYCYFHETVRLFCLECGFHMQIWFLYAKVIIIFQLMCFDAYILFFLNVR